jgi:parallel beta-helix repeat protein
MSRLPVPGGDTDQWGLILNDFLAQAHDTGGALLGSAVSTAGAEMTANKGAASGYAGLDSGSKVATANLGTGTANSTTYLRGDRTWATPSTVDSTAVHKSDLVFNIKDYGAVGNGSTDDTAAINSALTAAAGVGAVFMPAGTYVIGTSTNVSIPANTELFGAGPLTTLKIAANPVVNPILNAVNNGFTNVWLHDFAIDGNKTAIATATSGNPDINGSTGTGNNQIIWLSSNDATPATNIFIDRIIQTNSFRLGIVMQNVQGGRISGCKVSGNNRDGITIYYNCKSVEIAGNQVSDCGDDHIALNAENGTSTGHTMQDISIRGNTVYGPSSRSKGKGIVARGVDRLVIADNVVDSVSELGIYLANFNSTNLSHASVTGNIVHNTGSGGSAGKQGILVQANHSNQTATGTRGTITHVSIVGNTVTACGSAGIQLDSGPSGLTPSGFTGAAVGDLQYVTISANTVTACTTSTGAGIWVNSGPIDDVAITGNTVNANAQAGIQVTGANGPTPHHRLTITGNTANTNSTNGISVDTSAAVIITGNVCCNNTSNGISVTTITLACQFWPNVVNGNSNPINISGVSSTITMQQYTNAGVQTGKPTVNASGPSLTAALNTMGMISSTAARTVITASYTVLNTDTVIAVGAISSGITVTLPAASTMATGSTIIIKDENGNAATKNITIRGNGTDGIDQYSATTFPAMNTNYQVVRLYVRGTGGWAVW